MKLHYLAPVIVFILLLFGAIGSAMSQSPHFRFSSAHSMPTRLFGSSDEVGCEPACAQETMFGGKSRIGIAQKSCGQPQYVAPSCESSCGCESSCDYVPSKRCGTGCGCGSCGTRGIGALLGKLDVAVKGLFRCKQSACCDPCCYQTQCCPLQPTYGYELGCGYESDGYSMPVAPEPPHSPSVEGDPFGDDPVQLLAPPVPSEARQRTVSRSPIGTVTYTRPAIRNGATSPARFHPSNAIPIKRQARPTRSILDRGE